jgi:cytochrome c peroxidase
MCELLEKEKTMKTTKIILGFFVALVLVVAAGSASAAGPTPSNLTKKEKLGKNLFFDNRLSSPAGQSCASCHSPGSGFNGVGDANLTIYEGAVVGKFGNRNPPTAAYASFSPERFWNETDGLWIGGQFWDGRRNTVKEQAKDPFTNPVEMNNKSAAEVVAKVILSNYVGLFTEVCGVKTLLNTTQAFDCIAGAIAAYESSAEVNKFNSKYDHYLDGKATLSEQEQRGLALFNEPTKGNCAACHPSTPGDYHPSKPLFTDFSYDNLGVPRLPGSSNPTDLGLGGFLNDTNEYGKFKVPTLRNVGVAASYGHNGYFRTLKEITHFYNTRDVAAENWPDPEYNDTVNSSELGNLGLTDAEEDDIVAFMMTLTDGYAPPNPR